MGLLELYQESFRNNVFPQSQLKDVTNEEDGEIFKLESNSRIIQSQHIKTINEIGFIVENIQVNSNGKLDLILRYVGEI